MTERGYRTILDVLEYKLLRELDIVERSVGMYSSWGHNLLCQQASKWSSDERANISAIIEQGE